MLTSLICLSYNSSSLFGIVPNSMADERTGSTFAWLNSHPRKVPTLVRMIQVRQWNQHRPAVSTNITVISPSAI